MTANYQSYFAAGSSEFDRAIMQKKPLRILKKRLEADSKSTPLRYMASGAGYRALEMLTRTREGTGVRFGGVATWLNDSPAFCLIHFEREINAGSQRSSALLQTLFTAVQACVDRGYVSLTPQKPQRAAQSTPEASKEPAVLKVEIVSLPSRLTTSEVSRDDSGQITSSAQLERDV